MAGLTRTGHDDLEDYKRDEERKNFIAISNDKELARALYDEVAAFKATAKDRVTILKEKVTHLVHMPDRLEDALRKYEPEHAPDNQLLNDEVQEEYHKIEDEFVRIYTRVERANPLQTAKYVANKLSAVPATTPEMYELTLQSVEHATELQLWANCEPIFARTDVSEATSQSAMLETEELKETAHQPALISNNAAKFLLEELHEILSSVKISINGFRRSFTSPWPYERGLYM